jgi:N-methylhydantoinase A/oxoprolinase/acetone carboxylase beta subunit
MYGHADPRETVEVVTIRISAFGELDRHDAPEVARGTRTPPADARVDDRRALLRGFRSARRVPVYARDLLRARNVIEGPAIVDELDSTTVVGLGETATVDREGNLWIRKGSAR